MNKFIAMLSFVIFSSISCANTCANKGPTKEELALRAKMVKEVETFWENEKVMITLYFTSQTGQQISFEKTSIEFIDDKQMAVITTVFSSDGKMLGKCYFIIAKKLSGEWQVSTIVVRQFEEGNGQ